MDEQIAVKPKWNIEKLAFTILSVFTVVLPFFFIPSKYFPYQLGKGVLISTAVLLALTIYLISLIKEGRIELPKNLLLLSIFLIPAVSLVSVI